MNALPVSNEVLSERLEYLAKSMDQVQAKLDRMDTDIRLHNVRQIDFDALKGWVEKLDRVHRERTDELEKMIREGDAEVRKETSDRYVTKERFWLPEWVSRGVIAAVGLAVLYSVLAGLGLKR